MGKSKATEQPKLADIVDALRIEPGASVSLADRPTRDEAFFADKDGAKRSCAQDAETIDALQDRLFAERKRALLVVLQGLDSAGKSGTIRNVFNATGPIGVRVHAFGAPSKEELAQDYLWRIHQRVPPKGFIGVFDRSHYEDVLVVRVRDLAPFADVERRYEQINAFEKHLVENGVTIVKLMLHMSREVQGERLRERLVDPTKRWKFNPGDLDDRALWDDYQRAYEIMLERCSTAHAPWYVVPADSTSRRNAIVARLVRGALETMDPQYPDPGYRPEDFVVD